VSGQPFERTSRERLRKLREELDKDANANLRD